MREWTERHFIELIRKEWTKLKNGDEGGNLEELQGNSLKILGRGSYVKKLINWGIGYLRASMELHVLPYKANSGDITHLDYTYYSLLPVLSFYLTSVSDYEYSRVEGKADFIFCDDITFNDAGFGFSLPTEGLPETIKDFILSVATIFGGGDSGVRNLAQKPPVGTAYAYNFRGESKKVDIRTSGDPYFLSSINYNRKDYGGDGLNYYTLHLENALSDRSFGNKFVITTEKLEQKDGRELYNKVFTAQGVTKNTTETFSIKKIDLYDLFSKFTKKK